MRVGEASLISLREAAAVRRGRAAGNVSGASDGKVYGWAANDATRVAGPLCETLLSPAFGAVMGEMGVAAPPLSSRFSSFESAEVEFIAAVGTVAVVLASSFAARAEI